MTINLANIVAIAETVVLDETVDGLTAYGVYTTAKDVFGQLGLNFVTERGTEITSQHIYNAAKSGKVDGVKRTSQSGVRFAEDDVERFIATMVAKAKR